VDQRDGHVFVGNLLAADEQFTKPLLRFDQMRVLCGQLTRPQVTRLDGNVYVRSGDTGARTLLVWSPVAGENCVTELKTLADLQRLHPEFEAHGRVLNSDLRSVFKSPELGHYELGRALQGSTSAGPLPAEVRQLLDWTKPETLMPGAYPIEP
jgi:hypothetical protein